MTYLSSGAKNAGLYKDLDFIKRKLRYPLRKTLLFPLLGWSLMLLALALFTTIRLYTAFHAGNTAGLFPGLLPLVLSIPVIAGMLRYRRSLKFAVLPTRTNIAGNRLLLEKFLREQQLQVINHPMSKDIFQIVSTPVSAKTGDMRQVMVFIADEGRILLNSHFTTEGLMIAPASHLHHQMKAQLDAWISASGLQAAVGRLK